MQQDIQRWEKSKRKAYTRMLLSQSTIQDFLGIVVFLHKHRSGHLRFINNSMILQTHVEGLLRRAHIRDTRITLEGVAYVLDYVKLTPTITSEITKHWVSEEMYRKLKGEDASLPLCTMFKALPEKI